MENNSSSYIHISMSKILNIYDCHRVCNKKIIDIAIALVTQTTNSRGMGV